MEIYKNLGGDSSVVGYVLGNEDITVKFSDGSMYLYDNVNTGRMNVEEMKKLAREGQGLHGFIKRYIRNNYAAKLA
jgi:hypothetical protein